MKFQSAVNKVIENSNIVLEVLDARFINETRNKNLEQKIIDMKKQLIFVINKIDLVESKGIRKKISALKPRVEISARDRNGTAKLRGMIKRYAHKHRHTCVGVVGYPNTGKSTIINVLIGKAVASTSSQSGHTKGYQFVGLNRKILLIDSPGVFPPDQDDDHVLVSAVDFTKVDDPEYYVELIFEKFPGILERHYKVNSLETYCTQHHYLKKGGEPDLFRAARSILKDWQQGKVKV